MCGIAAIVDHREPPDARLAERIRDAMAHRGPDQAGSYADERVALAVRRLAIIDVEGGDQPIANEDGSVVVVLNGEIYNFQELRRDLTRRGHRFATASDTEVLVHLYEERGDELVHDLRGMFAFALWDRRRERLLCARDRLGKKPLFWHHRGERVALASELSALLVDDSIPRELDQRALEAYLYLQYVPAPLCAVAGVQKLPAASRLIVDERGARVERWWQLAHEPKLTGLDEGEAADRAWELIREATRLRLVAEVPVGAFLSGGLDSSAVVAAMAEESSTRVRTFSISFEEADFDEAAYARRVAEHLGTDHHEFHVRPDALETMPLLARHFGEPFADPAAIPTWYLAEQTRQHVTVALNGDGGDECFGGYGRYTRSLRRARLDPLTQRLRSPGARLGEALVDRWSRRFGSRTVRLAGLALMPPAQFYATALRVYDRGTRRRLVAPEMRDELGDWTAERLLLDAWDAVPADALPDRTLGTDLATYLPDDLLPKVDITTMAHSLEARSPLLDHELMEFTARLPAQLKLRDGSSKVLLRAALRGRVPDEVLDRPKMGFGVPLEQWFRGPLAGLPREMLLDPEAHTSSFLRRDVVERLIDRHGRGENHALRLWVLLQLESWCREVLHSPAPEATRV